MKRTSMTLLAPLLGGLLMGLNWDPILVVPFSASHTITYRLPDGPVYRLAAQAGAAPENVGMKLNALSAGSEDIWLNTSPDGRWLLPATETNDRSCDLAMR